MVLHGYVAMVKEHSVFEDGQTETCSSHFSTSSLVYAIKSFEKSIQVCVGHAYAIIAEFIVSDAFF